MVIEAPSTKNGSQQAVNAPMMTPSVLVALHSLTDNDGVDDRDRPAAATIPASAPATPPAAVGVRSAGRRRNAFSSLRHRRPLPPFARSSPVLPSTSVRPLSPTVLRAIPSPPSTATDGPMAFSSASMQLPGTARIPFRVKNVL